MSTPLIPLNCKIFYRPETTFGDGGEGNWLSFDFTDQLREDYEIGDPEKIYELHNVIGKGKTPSLIIEGGYKPGEQSTSFDLLTGILLKYALGTIETTTITATGEIPAHYHHVITPSNGQLPSFSMLIKQPFATPFTYQLKGIKVKSLEISAEIGENTPVRATADLIISSVAIVTDTPTTPSLSLRRFVFPDVSPLQITYNSQLISSPTLLNKFTLKIENEIEYKSEFGQEYATRVLEGKRTITVTTDQMIRSSDLLMLSKTYFRDYLTTITSSAKFTRNNYDYIDIAIDGLILKPMKNKLPSWESKQLMGELQFENAPESTITVTIKDQIETY